MGRRIGRAISDGIAFFLWGLWWGLLDGVLGGALVGALVVPLIGAPFGAIGGAVIGTPLGAVSGLVLAAFSACEHQRGVDVQAIGSRMPLVVTVTIVVVTALTAVIAHEHLPGWTDRYDLWGWALVIGAFAAALVLGRRSARSTGRWYVARTVALT